MAIVQLWGMLDLTWFSDVYTLLILVALLVVFAGVTKPSRRKDGQAVASGSGSTSIGTPPLSFRCSHRRPQRKARVRFTFNTKHLLHDRLTDVA